MRTIYLLLIFTFYICGYIYSQSKSRADYDYLVYLPKDYSGQTRNYPLVIYLHGGSHKGNDLNKLKEYGLPYLVDQGNDFDLLLYHPNVLIINIGLRIIGLNRYMKK